MNNSKENHEPQGLKFAVMAMFLVLILAGCKDLFHPEAPGAKNGGTYTVSYDANGGSGTAPAVQTVNAGVSILVAGSGLSKPGYIFSGWNTGADGTGDAYISGASLAVYMDITLYAQWTTEGTQCTVQYDANGGSGTVPAVQTVNVGTVITVAGGSGLSRSGYTFTGWNTRADGMGGVYAVGSSLSVYGNTTLYAQWTNQVTQYTVSYNANDGSGTPPASQTVIGGFIITVADGSGLSRSGYTFTGWNTNASGMGTAYAAGASLTVNANTTLYAQWAAIPTLRDLLDGLGTRGGTLTLAADYTLAPYTIGSGKTITLQGDDTERTVTLTGNGRLFTVQSGGKLILGNNVTLKGRGTNNDSLVYVSGTSSELTMNASSKITGNSASSYGGGVYIVSGSFTMRGGEISGNSVTRGSGGGAYVASGGSFIMSGGKISDNSATIYYSGGVHVAGGSFTMSGGEISGNSVSSYDGGGVFVSGSFTMSSGKISGNSATGNGGGVLIWPGSSFTMSGGEISSNTAFSKGGGVYAGAYVSSPSTFKKQPASGSTTSGVIYGYSTGDDKSNKVVSSGIVQPDKGSAVYVGGSSVKRRETTAGQTDHLDSEQDGSAGGWE